LLSIFNNTSRILGLPSLFVYLFMVWLLLICLIAWFVNRKASGD
jgi:hypothetical protein